MKIEKKMKNEKGSVLVLTIIAVLILSIMVTGLLNVGTTEIYTTQNFHLNKAAYYTAVQGVEEIRNMIEAFGGEQSPESIVVLPPTNAYTDSGGHLKYYITGSLKDLEDILSGTKSGGTPPETFDEFPTPLPPAISIGLGEAGTDIRFQAWKVLVTAKIHANKRTTYSEIIAGILAVHEN